MGEQARLLVTGGAGFIGANFVQFWLRRHPDDRVVVLDVLTYAGNTSSLEPVAAHPGFRFEQGDIRDRDRVEALLVEERIDTIVHLAAESHVDRSIAGPATFVEVNVVGTQALLDAARGAWLGPSRKLEGHRFHHVSTDEVYGSLQPGEPPFTESSPYAPSSPYAASKAASDHLVRAYWRTYGLHATISNCSNNYGPYQFPEKLVPLSLVNLLRGKEVPIYGDGQQIRDWLHVEDHCLGLERVLESGRVGATYNIGAADERTNLDLLRMLCRVLDRTLAATPALARRFPDSPAAGGGRSEELLRFVSDRPGHDRRYALDAGRARDELGFRPRVPLPEGLGSALSWYLGHEDWWRPLLDRSYREWIRTQYGS